MITPQFLVSSIMLGVMIHVILITVAYLIYLERKISAYIQDRLGPNRVGFDFGLLWLRKFFSLPGIRILNLSRALGLGQPLADGLKFLLKEDYRPTKTDLFLFSLAPIIVIVPAFIGFVVIPWGGRWDMAPIHDYPVMSFLFGLPGIGGLLDMGIGHLNGGLVYAAGAHVNVGIVYLLAVASLGVYGVTLGGWASNNKFSFLGSMRATAQMISYEIPMGLSLLAVLLVYGTFMPEGIIEAQRETTWGIISMPLAAILFFICALAEANRAPFDNAEAEQELVGGYHTEYSSMRFALFFLAEYAHMITGMAFFTLLFLGGWDVIPGVKILPDVAESFWVVPVKIAIFFGKVVLLVCFQMVIRWTLPRLRYDQIMMLGWQSLIPISLGLVVAVSVLTHFGMATTLWLLVTNVVLIGVVLMGQNRMTRSTINKKVPMYGSRFNPVPGEVVNTSPSHPMALADHPVGGTAEAVG